VEKIALRCNTGTNWIVYSQSPAVMLLLQMDVCFKYQTQHNMAQIRHMVRITHMLHGTNDTNDTLTFNHKYMAGSRVAKDKRARFDKPGRRCWSDTCAASSLAADVNTRI
jgi:tRNA isopentenyl-2-thiomethyl-A-37 hydroxylase MiaE